MDQGTLNYVALQLFFFVAVFFVVAVFFLRCSVVCNLVLSRDGGTLSLMIKEKEEDGDSLW